MVSLLDDSVDNEMEWPPAAISLGVVDVVDVVVDNEGMPFSMLTEDKSTNCPVSNTKRFVIGEMNELFVFWQ